MRSVTIALFAAICGCGLTFWMFSDSPFSKTANAQILRSGPVLPQKKTPPDEAKPLAPSAGFPEKYYNQDGLTPDEAINVAVYENCNKSVVNISTVGIRADRFFMMAVPEEGNGSGAILDKAGHILTNYHVIERARQISVTLFNEETYPAKLVGADPVNDIAVIKIEAPVEEMFPIPLGNSARLRVGMRVFALGNPFGLERTMSQGIISSLNRTLEVQKNWVIKSIIQIDASINPGNSGGPLIDARGTLIGMNTAIASRVAQSAGIGFAIPVNLIQRVVPELIKHGRVIRGDIGISHVTVTENGLRIARLTEGGPAERAGLRGPEVIRLGIRVLIDRSKADTIIALDEQPVASAAEFLGAIESKKPGDPVKLSVLRNDKVIDITVILGGEDKPNPGAVGI